MPATVALDRQRVTVEDGLSLGLGQVGVDGLGVLDGGEHLGEQVHDGVVVDLAGRGPDEHGGRGGFARLDPRALRI